MVLIELDISGMKKMTVMESTLNGSHVLKNQLKLNRVDNTLYIDIDPELFAIVLEYLRIGHIINSRFDTDVITGLFEYYFTELTDDMIRKIYKIKSIAEQVFAGNKVITFTDSMIYEISGIMHISVTSKEAFDDCKCYKKIDDSFRNFRATKLRHAISITKLNPLSNDITLDLEKWYNNTAKVCIIISQIIDMECLEDKSEDHLSFDKKIKIKIVCVVCFNNTNLNQNIDICIKNNGSKSLMYSSTFQPFRNFCSKFVINNKQSIYELLERFNNELITDVDNNFNLWGVRISSITNEYKLTSLNAFNDDNDLYLLKITKNSEYILKCENNSVIKVGEINILKTKYYLQLSF